MLTKKEGGRLTETNSWFRYHMPYTFTWIKSKYKHTYLPLNRNYKPLGYMDARLVDYNDYIDQAIVFTRDPIEITFVWHNRDGMYLYSDSYESRRDYFERLERLFSYSAKIINPPMYSSGRRPFETEVSK
jgi:hypothetical protein